MPRHNRRYVLKIRYTGKSKMHNTHFVANSSIGKNSKEEEGRVLRITKMRPEEVNRTNEFNPLPEKLMREFRMNREVIANG